MEAVAEQPICFKPAQPVEEEEERVESRSTRLQNLPKWLQKLVTRVWSFIEDVFEVRRRVCIGPAVAA
jgi:hypothetical protein